MSHSNDTFLRMSSTKSYAELLVLVGVTGNAEALYQLRTTDDEGNTALHLLASDPAVPQDLLSQLTKLDPSVLITVNKHQQTPLLIALEAGATGNVALLVSSNDQSLLVLDMDGRTPHAFATRKHLPEDVLSALAKAPDQSIDFSQPSPAKRKSKSTLKKKFVPKPSPPKVVPNTATEEDDDSSLTPQFTPPHGTKKRAGKSTPAGYYDERSDAKFWDKEGVKLEEYEKKQEREKKKQKVPPLLVRIPSAPPKIPSFDSNGKVIKEKASAAPLETPPPPPPPPPLPVPSPLTVPSPKASSESRLMAVLSGHGREHVVPAGGVKLCELFDVVEGELGLDKAAGMSFADRIERIEKA